MGYFSKKVKYGKLFTFGTDATEPYLEPDEPSLQPIIFCLQISSSSLIASTIVYFEAILVFRLHRLFLFACYIPRPFQISFLVYDSREHLLKSTNCN